VPSPSERGIPAVKNESLSKGLHQLTDITEILIIPAPLFRQKSVKRVVEIIIPLSIQAVSSLPWRLNDPNIVQVAFGDHHEVVAQLLRLAMNRLAYLIEDMLGTEIKDPVNTIEAKAIDMILCNPVKGISDDEFSDLITPWTVEIDRRSPGSFVAIRTIRPVIAAIISFRAKVVIDHIENHSQSLLVTFVDQPFQSPWPPIAVLRGVETGSIIPPISLPRELRDRHQFDTGHPEIVLQIIEMGENRFKGPFLSERSGVDFIKDRLLQRYSFPSLIFPLKFVWIDNLRRAVYSFGLISGNRIRS
jgi:hypothetical protein